MPGNQSKSIWQGSFLPSKSRNHKHAGFAPTFPNIFLASPTRIDNFETSALESARVLTDALFNLATSIQKVDVDVSDLKLPGLRDIVDATSLDCETSTSQAPSHLTSIAGERGAQEIRPAITSTSPHNVAEAQAGTSAPLARDTSASTSIPFSHAAPGEQEGRLTSASTRFVCRVPARTSTILPHDLPETQGGRHGRASTPADTSTSPVQAATEAQNGRPGSTSTCLLSHNLPETQGRAASTSTPLPRDLGGIQEDGHAHASTPPLQSAPEVQNRRPSSTSTCLSSRNLPEIQGRLARTSTPAHGSTPPAQATPEPQDDRPTKRPRTQSLTPVPPAARTKGPGELTPADWEVLRARHAWVFETLGVEPPVQSAQVLPNSQGHLEGGQHEHTTVSGTADPPTSQLECAIQSVTEDFANGQPPLDALFTLPHTQEESVLVTEDFANGQPPTDALFTLPYTQEESVLVTAAETSRSIEAFSARGGYMASLLDAALEPFAAPAAVMDLDGGPSPMPKEANRDTLFPLPRSQGVPVSLMAAHQPCSSTVAETTDEYLTSVLDAAIVPFATSAAVTKLAMGSSPLTQEVNRDALFPLSRTQGVPVPPVAGDEARSTMVDEAVNEYMTTVLDAAMEPLAAAAAVREFSIGSSSGPEETDSATLLSIPRDPPTSELLIEVHEPRHSIIAEASGEYMASIVDAAMEPLAAAAAQVGYDVGPSSRPDVTVMALPYEASESVQVNTPLPATVTATGEYMTFVMDVAMDSLASAAQVGHDIDPSLTSNEVTVRALPYEGSGSVQANAPFASTSPQDPLPLVTSSAQVSSTYEASISAMPGSSSTPSATHEVSLLPQFNTSTMHEVTLLPQLNASTHPMSAFETSDVVHPGAVFPPSVLSDVTLLQQLNASTLSSSEYEASDLQQAHTPVPSTVQTQPYPADIGMQSQPFNAQSEMHQANALVQPDNSPSQLSSWLHYKYSKHITAADRKPGQAGQRMGASAANISPTVPLSTAPIVHQGAPAWQEEDLTTAADAFNADYTQREEATLPRHETFSTQLKHEAHTVLQPASIPFPTSPNVRHELAAWQEQDLTTAGDAFDVAYTQHDEASLPQHETLSAHLVHEIHAPRQSEHIPPPTAPCDYQGLPAWQVQDLASAGDAFDADYTQQEEATLQKHETFSTQLKHEAHAVLQFTSIPFPSSPVCHELPTWQEQDLATAGNAFDAANTQHDEAVLPQHETVHTHPVHEVDAALQSKHIPPFSAPSDYQGIPAWQEQDVAIAGDAFDAAYHTQHIDVVGMSRKGLMPEDLKQQDIALADDMRFRYEDVNLSMDGVDRLESLEPLSPTSPSNRSHVFEGPSYDAGYLSQFGVEGSSPPWILPMISPSRDHHDQMQPIPYSSSPRQDHLQDGHTGLGPDLTHIYEEEDSQGGPPSGNFALLQEHQNGFGASLVDSAQAYVGPYIGVANADEQMANQSLTMQYGQQSDIDPCQMHVDADAGVVSVDRRLDYGSFATLHEQRHDVGLRMSDPSQTHADPDIHSLVESMDWVHSLLPSTEVTAAAAAVTVAREATDEREGLGMQREGGLLTMAAAEQAAAAATTTPEPTGSVTEAEVDGTRVTASNAGGSTISDLVRETLAALAAARTGVEDGRLAASSIEALTTATTSGFDTGSLPVPGAIVHEATDARNERRTADARETAGAAVGTRSRRLPRPHVHATTRAAAALADGERALVWPGCLPIAGTRSDSSRSMQRPLAPSTAAAAAAGNGRASESPGGLPIAGTRSNSSRSMQRSFVPSTAAATADNGRAMVSSGGISTAGMTSDSSWSVQRPLVPSTVAAAAAARADNGRALVSSGGIPTAGDSSWNTQRPLVPRTAAGTNSHHASGPVLHTTIPADIERGDAAAAAIGTGSRQVPGPLVRAEMLEAWRRLMLAGCETLKSLEAVIGPGKEQTLDMPEVAEAVQHHVRQAAKDASAETRSQNQLRTSTPATDLTLAQHVIASRSDLEQAGRAQADRHVRSTEPPAAGRSGMGQTSRMQAERHARSIDQSRSGRQTGLMQIDGTLAPSTSARAGGCVPVGEVVICVIVYPPGRKDGDGEEYLVLGSQPLTALFDKISCITALNLQHSGLSTPGSVFFCEGCLYEDDRGVALEHSVPTYGTGNSRVERIAHNQASYAPSLIAFCREKRIRPLYFDALRHLCDEEGVIGPHGSRSRARRSSAADLSLAAMAETKWGQLTVRPGSSVYYWYCHQGNCEHLVQVRDVRLHHPLDPSLISDYPHPIQRSVNKRRNCDICVSGLGTKVTYNDALAVANPTIWCERCFDLMHCNTAGSLRDPTLHVFPYSTSE